MFEWIVWGWRVVTAGASNGWFTVYCSGLRTLMLDGKGRGIGKHMRGAEGGRGATKRQKLNATCALFVCGPIEGQGDTRHCLRKGNLR